MLTEYKSHISKACCRKKRFYFFRFEQPKAMPRNLLLFHDCSRAEAYQQCTVFLQNTMYLTQCRKGIRPEINRVYCACLCKRIGIKWKCINTCTPQFDCSGFYQSIKAFSANFESINRKIDACYMSTCHNTSHPGDEVSTAEANFEDMIVGLEL